MSAYMIFTCTHVICEISVYLHVYLYVYMISVCVFTYNNFNFFNDIVDV